MIEQRERGEKQLPVITDEVAASLAAAEVLTQLREIAVPPEFAGYLELYIRARARNFGQQTSTALPVVRPRGRAGVRRSWTAVLGFAAVLLAACISILTASARSLPGDTLYGLKQAEYQLTLNFASGPQDRASAQIDQLRNALVDLRTVVTAGRADDAIGLALSSVAAKTHASRGAVAPGRCGANGDAGPGTPSEQWNAADYPDRHPLCPTGRADDRRATRGRGEPEHLAAARRGRQRRSVVCWPTRAWGTQSRRDGCPAGSQ